MLGTENDSLNSKQGNRTSVLKPHGTGTKIWWEGGWLPRLTRRHRSSDTALISALGKPGIESQLRPRLPVHRTLLFSITRLEQLVAIVINKLTQWHFSSFYPSAPLSSLCQDSRVTRCQRMAPLPLFTPAFASLQDKLFKDRDYECLYF